MRNVRATFSRQVASQFISESHAILGSFPLVYPLFFCILYCLLRQHLSELGYPIEDVSLFRNVRLSKDLN